MGLPLLSSCYGLNGCLQKFIYWNITPNIGDRAFEGWLGHVSEALMDRISAPMKTVPELPSHSCHEKNTTKKWLSMNQIVDSHQAKSAGTLILHFQSPELGQINFCYTYTTLSVVSAIAAGMDQDSI